MTVQLLETDTSVAVCISWGSVLLLGQRKGFFLNFLEGAGLCFKDAVDILWFNICCKFHFTLLFVFYVFINFDESICFFLLPSTR